MKGYDLGDLNPAQYASLTDAEKAAWHNPARDSYHSLHVERMGTDTFRWRDSRTAKFYVGTAVELLDACLALSLRRLDPDFEKAVANTQVLKILSQDEIDDLFSDL